MRQQACAKGGRSTAARFIVAGAIIGLILASAEAGYGQLTEGPLSPAAVVDDSSFGGAGWFPASNAIASDDLYALAAPGMSPTHYLKATTFGFAIPAPAQIQGIEVFVERHAALGTIFDSRARIVKGGVIGTAERALGGNWPSVTDATVTYGNPSDLWGETWTPADINNNGFGFALSVDDNVDTAAVDHISITVHYTLCAAAPAGGCRTALKSVLVLKDNATNAKDKLVWKWIKGQNTSTAEFGDPVMGTANIALCVYDNGVLEGSTLVAPGTGWSAISTKGWKFLDKTGAQDGVQKIILKASTNGKSKALVKGKGINLPDITPPMTGPVTVQLVNSQSGVCWQSLFSFPFLKNVAGSFKDKTP
ncbi:MAG TPA: hypothetical protein VL049_15800 [Candidatus Dormibacteraeota bacterium]|nr:hypothetical protein [Candidatus Dormibacteraeota bacterium]